ncbi:MAG: hypothetical protein AABZ67_12565 [Pseudomonadota bacterium]
MRKERDEAMSQNSRQPQGKFLITCDIACRVAAGIGAAFVGRLGHIRDMACAVLRVIADSGRNAHVFHYC